MTSIRVFSRYDGDSLILVVEDDGVGIKDNDRQKLFTRGFGENTGLGLFLVREILAITGLTIHETGSSGCGARFEIRVPEGKYRTAGNGPAGQDLDRT
jgi:signal transduction histidine kinase